MNAWFERSAAAYEEAARGSVFPLDRSSLYPCDDRSGATSYDAHYARCDLWAAKHIIAAGLRTHVDVGSRIDGFCTHLFAGGVEEVLHVDVRPTHFGWPGFTFRRDDARTLATFPDASVPSLSCLHTAEHVGLGRYGDELDADGMQKAMAAFARVLAPGGRLYFAVPIGRQRVCFNAHRISSPAWIARTFAALGLEVESFSAVDDAGAWRPNATTGDFENASYGCGCFLLRGAA